MDQSVDDTVPDLAGQVDHRVRGLQRQRHSQPGSGGVALGRHPHGTHVAGSIAINMTARAWTA